MICYKDMTFCTAKDCAKLDCPRNTKGANFKPDEFWKDKIAWANFKESCPEYRKEEE